MINKRKERDRIIIIKDKIMVQEEGVLGKKTIKENINSNR